MKIAVNTRLLLKGRLEGIGWFTYEILKRITRNHPEHQFLFIFDRPYNEEFIFSDNVEAVVIGPQARHPFLFLLWFELSIPYVLKKHQVDIFLSPDSYISLSSKVPSISVIHDLNFEYYPKDIPFFARIYSKIMFPRFARKAKKIATVSQYSKNDIENLYKIDGNKINVIYNAAKESFKSSSDAEIISTKKEFTDSKPYFLFVGALNPRKNLVNLFKSFDQLVEEEGKNVKLAVVGNKMYWTKEIENAYHNMKNKEEVVFLGHLGTKELSHVYGAALALTYISYFEGFGIPIVEAFRCQCPVITSNVTSMPEVAGSAALLVDPFNVNDIKEAMKKVLNSPDLRSELIEKGNKRVQDFSWDKSAEKLWDTISEVV